MYWTLELASTLDDAPWPASKDELIDYAQRSGAPLEVIEILEEIEDEGEIYETFGRITLETKTSSSTKKSTDRTNKKATPSLEIKAFLQRH